MTYTLTQATYKRLKTRLTTKTNKLKAAITQPDKDALIAAARAVIKECEYAMAIFEDQGSPDSWSNWDRAKDEAELQIRIRGGSRV